MREWRGKSCAGMAMMCLVSLDGVFVEFPRARELWIPAFAGMADDGVDSRVRGNGVEGSSVWE